MRLSNRPDPWNAWIYDYQRPDYYSDEAKDLLARRDAALRGAPPWMKEEARMNDEEDDRRARAAKERLAFVAGQKRQV